MAIGGKRDADDAGIKRGEGFRRKAMPGDRARPIALQEDIGMRGQITQTRAIIRRAQIKRGGSFAAPGIHHQFIETRQMHGADVQNIGTMCGQSAPSDRPGNHPRQVNHTHAT